MSILLDWLNTYSISTAEELVNAKREIMQEIVLAGLARGGFFSEATFYGGTALRVHYGLDRYSEDLDFSLNRVDANFSLEKYFEAIHYEFIALGINVSLKLKEKRHVTPVESAFLKEDTYWGLLTLQTDFSKVSNLPHVKIKIEIDKTPPLLFDRELKTIIRPSSLQVSCMTLPSLFAGKMHAVLYRAGKSREKGRDWYDLEWYIRKGVKLPLAQLRDRAINSKHLDTNDIFDEGTFMEILQRRVNALNVESVKHDVINFIPDSAKLNIWSTQYFHDLTSHIKFV
ncbi:MAG: hypothetical protein RL660_1544 [Bacteroidota bacterium]|jgi:predicted nucleotidyltransferase component of viral defense system